MEGQSKAKYPRVHSSWHVGRWHLETGGREEENWPASDTIAIWHVAACDAQADTGVVM